MKKVIRVLEFSARAAALFSSEYFSHTVKAAKTQMLEKLSEAEKILDGVVQGSQAVLPSEDDRITLATSLKILLATTPEDARVQVDKVFLNLQALTGLNSSEFKLSEAPDDFPLIEDSTTEKAHDLWGQYVPRFIPPTRDNE